MIDYDILEECGTTQDRLRQFFTAQMPSEKKQRSMTAKELKDLEREIKKRKEYESRIGSWLQEAIVFSLANHHRYSAVDCAWDSTPINQAILPLMLYAQGRIDFRACSGALKNLPEGQKYVKKNDLGQVQTINLPKFYECNINLIRSVITRRGASQSNKYNNLYPHWKYEPRSKSQVGKLRAEMTSERMDIMADQFDYRNFEEQVRRDVMMYGHSVAFPRCAWEKEVQWEKAPIADEFSRTGTTTGKIPKRDRIVKEGVCFSNPHAGRLIWDNNYPLSSLNCDIGCEWIGFWDVARYGDVADNPSFFNRKAVAYSADTAGWFTAYSTFFNQYYDRITPPQIPVDPTGRNDRKQMVGLYTGEMRDAGTFQTHLYVKEIPKTWGWGTYPFPVWVHLVVAGDSTVMFAEIMPSTPAAVFSFNENDGRLVNISLAHELMSYQDQLTNLFSQFLETLKADLFSVAVLNEDIFPDTDDGRKVKAEFKQVMSGNSFYATTQVLMASFAKLQQLGIPMTADNIFKIVRSPPNTKLTDIFKSIMVVVQMAERLVWMSPAEQGQAAPHEVTAREVGEMAGTTDEMRNYFSDACDRGRAAMKRICFESWMAKGSDDVELAVINRYPKSIVEKAGFTVKDEDCDGDIEGSRATTLIGNKRNVQHDYIFTTRDGSERAADTKAATVLVELLGRLGGMVPEAQRAIFGSMGKEKLFEIINEIFRMADASLDLKLDLKPGEEDTLLLEDDEQVMGLIQRLGAAVEQNTKDLATLQQQIAQFLQQQIPPRLAAA